MFLVNAQNPTTVTTANNCSVFRNFNSSSEGFSSPSIYSTGDDVSFFWNSGTGNEVENSGLVFRTGSLISPIYFNSAPGEVTVGFSYAAPANTQYRVRVISGVIGSPLEVLATTANGPAYSNLPGTSGNICLRLQDQDLLVGAEVRFEFTFRAFLPGNISFDDLSLTVAAGPLPVNFLGFVARKNTDGTVKFLWNVGDEINVKGYYVEASTNGSEFTNVGYVTATGKSNYSLDYIERINQTTFFRVKNVDFDNKFRYSPIIKLYANERTDVLNVYPVPADNMITVEHGRSNEKAQITLMSIEGRLVKQVSILPSTLQTQIDIATLDKGVYIIRYDDGLGTLQSMKFVKN